MHVRPLTTEERAALPGRVTHTAGSHIAVTPLRTYDIRELDGFAAVEDDCVAGIVTYAAEDQHCEIVTIDAFEAGRGVGAALLSTVKSIAIDRGCSRLTLFTTNDNLRAKKFFKNSGFRLAAFYLDSMNAVRRAKPEVPMTGDYGIPLRDMFEYEMHLRSSDRARPER